MMALARILPRRRIRDWISYALLAGLLIRALIPVGFMPGASGLEFCQGGMPAMAAITALHSHHHADGDAAPSHGTGHAEGCVFAGSASGPAPLCAPVTIGIVLVATAYSVPSTAVTSTPTILRAQSPRGPPALS